MGVLNRKIDFDKIKEKIWMIGGFADGNLRRCVITIVQYQNNVQTSSPHRKPSLIAEGANERREMLLFIPCRDSYNWIQSQKILSQNKIPSKRAHLKKLQSDEMFRFCRQTKKYRFSNH